MSLEKQLLNLNQRGVFPGPSESEEAFFQRVDSLRGYAYCSEIFREKFNSFPDWIQINIGSNGLTFWEGAATWIEENEDGSRSCQIQLKDSWLTRLYPKEEIIAHEMVHAMRHMFDERRFEEILAYQTSKNRFRRYFGPIFSSPKESKCFITLLLISILSSWAEIAFDFNLVGNSICTLPLLALGFGFFRLNRSQRVFSKAMRNLEKVIHPHAKPLEVALRLTDCEIELFAKYSSQEIRAFAKQQRSLRWKQLDPLFALESRSDS